MLSGEFPQLHALLKGFKGGNYGFLQLYELSKAAEIQVDGAPRASTLSQALPLQHLSQKERSHRSPSIPHTTSDPRVNVGLWIKRRCFHIFHLFLCHFFFVIGTQDDQDHLDEETRHQARESLTQSWKDRLSVISLIVRSTLPFSHSKSRPIDLRVSHRQRSSSPRRLNY